MVVIKCDFFSWWFIFMPYHTWKSKSLSALTRSEIAGRCKEWSPELLFPSWFEVLAAEATAVCELVFEAFKFRCCGNVGINFGSQAATKKNYFQSTKLMISTQFSLQPLQSSCLAPPLVVVFQNSQVALTLLCSHTSTLFWERNVLTRRREYGTYLATARRHRRRIKMQKRDE